MKAVFFNFLLLTRAQGTISCRDQVSFATINKGKISCVDTYSYTYIAVGGTIEAEAQETAFMALLDKNQDPLWQKYLVDGLSSVQGKAVIGLSNCQFTSQKERVNKKLQEPEKIWATSSGYLLGFNPVDGDVVNALDFSTHVGECLAPVQGIEGTRVFLGCHDKEDLWTVIYVEFVQSSESTVKSYVQKSYGISTKFNKILDTSLNFSNQMLAVVGHTHNVGAIILFNVESGLEASFSMQMTEQLYYSKMEAVAVSADRVYSCSHFFKSSKKWADPYLSAFTYKGKRTDLNVFIAGNTFEACAGVVLDQNSEPLFLLYTSSTEFRDKGAVATVDLLIVKATDSLTTELHWVGTVSDIELTSASFFKEDSLYISGTQSKLTSTSTEAQTFFWRIMDYKEAKTSPCYSFTDINANLQGMINANPFFDSEGKIIEVEFLQADFQRTQKLVEFIENSFMKHIDVGDGELVALPCLGKYVQDTSLEGSTFVYYIGHAKASFYVPIPQHSLSCTDLSTQVTIRLDKEGESLISSVFKVDEYFNSTHSLIQVYTDRKSQMDVYPIISTYESKNVEGMAFIQQRFDIEIRNNTHPHLQSNMKDKIFLTDGVWNSYQLPMIEDTESSPVKIVLMNDPIDFIFLEAVREPNELYQTYTLRFNPVEKDRGFYYIKLLLDEENSEFDTEFDMTVVVEKQELFPTITNLTIEGQLVVRFNHEISIPKDIDLIEAEGLNIWVEGPLGSSTEGKSSDYYLDWRIDKINSTTLVIKLIFDNPSTIGLSRKDKVFLQILANEQFVSSEYNLTMTEMTEPLEYKLDLIMDSENFYVQWVLAYDLIQQPIILAIYAAGLLANYYMNISMEYLWILSNTVQICMLLPMVNTLFPTITYYFFGLFQFAFFKFFRIDSIFYSYYGIDMGDEEGKLHNPYWKYYGVRSYFMGGNCPDQLIMYFFYFFLFSFAYLASACQFMCCGLQQAFILLISSVSRCCSKYLKPIKYNLLVRIVINTFLPIMFFSFLNIRFHIYYEGLFDLMNIVGSILFVIFLIYFFSHSLYVLNIMPHFDLEKGRIGSYYQHQKPEKKAFFYNIIIFFVRRFLIAFVLAMSQEAPIFQVIFLLLQQLGFMYYIYKIKPYKENRMNKFQMAFEFINLSCILMLFLLLEELNMNPINRVRIAISMMCVFGGSLTLGLLFAFLEITHKIYKEHVRRMVANKMRKTVLQERMEAKIRRQLFGFLRKAIQIQKLKKEKELLALQQETVKNETNETKNQLIPSSPAVKDKQVPQKDNKLKNQNISPRNQPKYSRETQENEKDTSNQKIFESLNAMKIQPEQKPQEKRVTLKESDQKISKEIKARESKKEKDLEKNIQPVQIQPQPKEIVGVKMETKKDDFDSIEKSDEKPKEIHIPNVKKLKPKRKNIEPPIHKPKKWVNMPGRQDQYQERRNSIVSGEEPQVTQRPAQPVSRKPQDNLAEKMKQMLESEEKQAAAQKKKSNLKNSIELDPDGEKQVGLSRFSLRQTALTAQKIQQMMEKYKK